MAPTILSVTKRQREILELAATGLTSKQIGHKLGLSPKTVDCHFDRVQHRLGARTRSHAVVIWKDLQLQERQLAEDIERQRKREGFDHCPTCGGLGFVRAAA